MGANLINCYNSTLLALSQNGAKAVKVEVSEILFLWLPPVIYFQNDAANFAGLIELI